MCWLSRRNHLYIPRSHPTECVYCSAQSFCFLEKQNFLFTSFNLKEAMRLCHLSHLHLSCTSAEKAFLGHWVVLCSPEEESSCGPFLTKTQRRCFWMEVYQRLSEFAHTQMEKVWSRIILVHNSFFLSYSMFGCAMSWFLVITFFSTSVPLFWSTESVDSVGTTIFTLPKVISSFIFYWYQFDVCLFSNECQQYVFLVVFFFFFFFFQLSLWFFFLVHRHVLTQ